MEKYRVVILTADDWEGLFVDGRLIDQSHKLGDGDHRLFLLKMAEQYSFTSKDIVVKYIDESNEEDYNFLEDFGRFPELLSELKGNYDEIT